MWVGNARAAAQLFIGGFGFHCVAYAGPETGSRDRCSYVLQQGAVRLILTAGLDPGSEVWRHVQQHGDGVKALSFAVDDPAFVFDSLVARGATPVAAPSISRDDIGFVVTASVRTYGETVHHLTCRRHPVYAPGFTDEGLIRADGRSVGLRLVDHVVGNVPQGELDQWVEFYERVFGFRELTHFDRDQISTEYSALRSTVVTNGVITMPINEPAPGRKRSQIEEYLEAYHERGVQHIALRTDDIVTAVSEMRRRGIRFLEPPASYYDDDRGLDLPWHQLAPLGILVDREGDGYLLQVFTEPTGDRPTLFFEIIERHGATGFGEGNFKALFEAIEREQARRGNL